MQSAHPKIQKMCEEESDDQEAVAKLLEINDSIHRTIERYKLVKKGDVEAAAKIPKGTLGTTTGVGKNAANELSLIDFEPEAPAPGDANGSSAPPGQATSVEDDLLGLSMNDQPYGQTGGISLGFGSNAGVPGPALLSSTMQQHPAQSPAPLTSPPASTQSSKANYDAFSAFTSNRPISKPATPVPSMQQQMQAPAPAPAPPTQASFDPFATLVSPNPRAGTATQGKPASNSAAPSSSLLDLADTSIPPGAANNATKADDDWNFVSAQSEDASHPMSHTQQVHSSLIKIIFASTRQVQDQSIHVTADFSNSTPQPVTGLHFQVAAQKVGFPHPLSPRAIDQRAPIVLLPRRASKH